MNALVLLITLATPIVAQAGFTCDEAFVFTDEEDMIISTAVLPAFSDAPPECTSGTIGSPFWFKLIGTGEPMSVGTCLNDFSEVCVCDVPIFSLVQGPCSSINAGNESLCVSYDEFTCSDSGGYIVWSSVQGVEYYVMADFQSNDDITVTRSNLRCTSGCTECYTSGLELSTECLQCDSFYVDSDGGDASSGTCEPCAGIPSGSWAPGEPAYDVCSVGFYDNGGTVAACAANPSCSGGIDCTGPNHQGEVCAGGCGPSTYFDSYCRACDPMCVTCYDDTSCATCIDGATLVGSANASLCVCATGFAADPRGCFYDGDIEVTSDNTFSSIQIAADFCAASPLCNKVTIPPGVYVPDGIASRCFHGGNCEVCGLFLEIEHSQMEISGEGVVLDMSSADNATFSICINEVSDGVGLLISGVEIRNGGGIYTEAALEITGMKFINFTKALDVNSSLCNVARTEFIGGMYDYTIRTTSHIVMDRCLFMGNTATGGETVEEIYYEYGGAVTVTDATTAVAFSVTRCAFHDNTHTLINGLTVTGALMPDTLGVCLYEQDYSFTYAEFGQAAFCLDVFCEAAYCDDPGGLPPGFFYNASSDEFRTCPGLCDYCPDGLCATCESPYLRLFDECVAECPEGYLSNGTSCVTCTLGCASCTLPDDNLVVGDGCLLCDNAQDYYDSNGDAPGGVCTPAWGSCAPQYYRNTVNMTSDTDCKACSPGCANCSRASISLGDGCGACAAGYHDNNGVAAYGTCVSVTSQCASGFFSLSGNVDSDTSCMPCEPNSLCAGVVTCTGATRSGEECQGSCVAAAYNQDGQCTSCSTGCAECSAAGLSLADGGACSVCSTGYIDSNGPSPGGACTALLGAILTACDAGFRFNVGTSTCEACLEHAEGCLVHDSATCVEGSFQACTAPSSGYGVSAGVPVVLPCGPHQHNAPTCVCVAGYHGTPIATDTAWSDACQPCDGRCSACSDASNTCTCSTLAQDAGGTCLWTPMGAEFLSAPSTATVGDPLLPVSVKLLNGASPPGNASDVEYNVVLSSSVGNVAGTTRVGTVGGIATFHNVRVNKASTGAQLLASVEGTTVSMLSDTFAISAKNCEPSLYLDTVSAACVPCPPGAVAPNSGQLACSVCEVGKYSSLGVSCDECNPGAVCELGIERARPGFMRLSAHTYVECQDRDTHACPGGDGDHTCGEGHTGHLCSQCLRSSDAIYAKNRGARCARCWPAALSVIVVVVALALIVIFVAAASRSPPELAESNSGLNACVKILVNHIQIISIISTFSMHAGSAFRSAVGWTDAATGLSLNAFPIRCLLDMNYYSVALLTLAVQGVAIIFIVLGGVVYGKVKGESVVNSFASPLVVWLFLSYPSVTLTFLKIFKCRGDVGSLAEDPSLACPSSQYSAYVAIAVVVIVVWTVGIPAAFFLVVKRTRPDSDLWSALFFLHRGFALNVPYYEAANMLKKTLFVVIASQVNSPIVQLACAAAVLCVAGVLNKQLRPYEDAKMNSLESDGLVVLMLTVAASIMFLNESETDTEFAIASLVLVLIANAAFLGFLVGVLIKGKAPARLADPLPAMFALQTVHAKVLENSQDDVDAPGV